MFMGSTTRGRRGQAMLELALILPMLLVLAFGVVDLGRMFRYQEAIANAAREGANYGSVYRQASLAQIADAARAEAPGIGPLGVTAARGADPVEGRYVTVSVTYRFDLATPLIQDLVGANLVLKATSKMPVALSMSS